jgi:hypothetical protein
MPRLALLAWLLTLPYISSIAAEDVGPNFDTKNTKAFEHDFGPYPYRTFR